MRQKHATVKEFVDLISVLVYPGQALAGTGGHTKDNKQLKSKCPVTEELCIDQKHFSSSQISCSSK